MANTSGTFSSTREIKPNTSEDIQEQVRRRAYGLYELRGREHGHEVEDWREAESELLPQRQNRTPTSRRRFKRVA